MEPVNFSVIMADQTAAFGAGIVLALNTVVTSGAAGALRLGCIDYVMLDGVDDLLLLGKATMIERLGIDVEYILASCSESDLPTGQWVSVKEVIPATGVSVDALKVARGAEGKIDTSSNLITDAAPVVMMSPDEEQLDRLNLLKANIAKAEKAGLDGEALEDVKQAVLVDYIDNFRAGVREDDPTTNVTPMTIKLKPRAYPVHARPRQAAPVKPNFLRSNTKTNW